MLPPSGFLRLFKANSKLLCLLRFTGKGLNQEKVCDRLLQSSGQGSLRQLGLSGEAGHGSSKLAHHQNQNRDRYQRGCRQGQVELHHHPGHG